MKENRSRRMPAKVLWFSSCYITLVQLKLQTREACVLREVSSNLAQMQQHHRTHELWHTRTYLGEGAAGLCRVTAHDLPLLKLPKLAKNFEICPYWAVKVMPSRPELPRTREKFRERCLKQPVKGFLVSAASSGSAVGLR